MSKKTARYDPNRHQIVNVDQDRLILCGLLNKVPKRSKVVQRILAGNKKRYTAQQKMHITATYWMPDLPKTWIWWQFENWGMNPEWTRRLFENIAYDPACRAKYTPVAERNVQFIGHAEIERYYQRRDRRLGQVQHPVWAIPYFKDMRKKGLKLREIGERLDLTVDQVNYVLRHRDNMFYTPNRGEWRT